MAWWEYWRRPNPRVGAQPPCERRIGRGVGTQSGGGDPVGEWGPEVVAWENFPGDVPRGSSGAVFRAGTGLGPHPPHTPPGGPPADCAKYRGRRNPEHIIFVIFAIFWGYQPLISSFFNVLFDEVFEMQGGYGRVALLKCP